MDVLCVCCPRCSLPHNVYIKQYKDSARSVSPGKRATSYESDALHNLRNLHHSLSAQFQIGRLQTRFTLVCGAVKKLGIASH